MDIQPIAHVESPYLTKFGVPRQPNLADAVISRLVFEPGFRIDDALPGLESLERIWVVWAFSHNDSNGHAWHRTVRPPRLGGNTRMGVFATRSSFRPNALAISPVELRGVRSEGNRVVIDVVGGDMVDGTPVFAVTPYDEQAHSRRGASSGWVEENAWHLLSRVEYEEGVAACVPTEIVESLEQVLFQDPRPAYTRSGQEEREFWMPFAGLAVRFRIEGDVVHVCEATRLTQSELEQIHAHGTLNSTSR